MIEPICDQLYNKLDNIFFENQKKWAQLFVADNDTPKYFFGTRDDAPIRVLNAYPNIKIAGIIDEFTFESYYHGIPILHSTEEIPNEHRQKAIVCYAVWGHYKNVKDRLDSVGLKQNFWFCTMAGLLSDSRIEPYYWQGFRAHYKSNIGEYKQLIESVGDTESKLTLSSLINFRLSGDVRFLSSFIDNTQRQYWEPFLPFHTHTHTHTRREVFVDVGAYDGMTSLEYINRIKDFSKIYLFEPIPQQMEICKKNLNKYLNIVYCQVGAWNIRDTLFFIEDGTASGISKQGTMTLNVDVIDAYVDETIDAQVYIKMDIEGAEKQAIDGARATILKHHPTLAICVYHCAEDYLEVYKKVMSIRDDYKIYVRHYTSGITETVMYFVPIS